MDKSSGNTFLFLCIVSLFVSEKIQAQHAAVAADKMNVFYLGVDNSVSIAAENCSCSQLVVKASNGSISGADCKYVVQPKNVGRCDITVYKKIGNKLRKIESSAFRVKMIPLGTFCIGPYCGSRSMAIQKVIAAQEYVRAELMNSDYDLIFQVDSFTVTIRSDSSADKVFLNVSNKINPSIRSAFALLQKNDRIIFEKIFAKGSDGIGHELEPVILEISE